MLSISRVYNSDNRMINEYEAVDGMRIGMGNKCTPRKPTPVLFCLPQTPHDLTLERTWATMVVPQ
jgi:hypothetical protein